MAREALAILRDRPRWEAMSRRAAIDARERFSVDDIVGQYEALYSSRLANVLARRLATSPGAD